MTPGPRAALVTAVVLAAGRVAAADRVAVKVVELAFGQAYIEPGRDAGILPGAKLHIAGRDLVVLEATARTAVVQLDTGKVTVGDTGTVEVTPGQVDGGSGKLAAARPLSAWTGQWGQAVRPATTQTPGPVPLGAGPRVASANHVTVLGHGDGTVDKHGVDGEIEGRVIASFELSRDRPLAADLDVAARAYRTGGSSGARVPLVVHAAQLRDGDAQDPRFALGRLRYAASGVGMLDGGRAALRTGVFEVAAFGGLVPDPVNAAPDTSASRFGVEAAYDDPRSAWQPRVALTLYGSTWRGAVDERRAALTASAGHASTYLTGWAELQSFAAGNPFGARGLELTGGGASGEFRTRSLHAGVDLTYLTPERSLRLAAALPPEWLCTRIPQRGDLASEACKGGDSWSAASASAGWRDAGWTLDGVGSIGLTHGLVKTVDFSGYVRGERRFGTQRLSSASPAGARASRGGSPARWGSELRRRGDTIS